MTYKPAKITARWNKDLTVTLYASGKKLIKVNIGYWHKSADEAIAPFCAGWFGSDNPADWRVKWKLA